MPQRVQSIERAAAIMRLLARAPGPVGVVDLATSLGLAKGTVHGIVRTLHDVGFVDQEGSGGRYLVGRAWRELGSTPIDANELRSLALNWADALAARTATAVRVGTLMGGSVLVVHHVFRPDGSVQTLDVGTTLPLHATASGKTLLAYDPGTASATLRRPLRRHTERTIVDPERFRRQLLEVRGNGWAVDLEEHTRGEASIAAPIRDHGGLVVAALAVTGSLRAICGVGGRPKPALISKVTEAAAAVTREVAERR